MPQEFIPQYAVVINGIIQKIHDGVYRPGAKLPGVRQLAAEYNVGRQVAHYALNHLAQRDYVYAEPKRGVFVNPKLKPGRFYRLGLFIANTNPAQQGLLIHAVATEASSADCEVILLSNFDNGISLAEKLRSDMRYDGLVLTGEVNEKLLTAIRPFHIPYIVLGNYAISAEHLQQRVDLQQAVTEVLIPEFRAFAGKRIAALMGDASFAADREGSEAVRSAIIAAGAEYAPELVVNTVGDGYRECCELFESARFDVLYIHGNARSGYSKYCELRNPSPRPFVICNIVQRPPNSRTNACFDRRINIDANIMDIAAVATARLLNMIEKKATPENKNQGDL